MFLENRGLGEEGIQIRVSAILLVAVSLGCMCLFLSLYGAVEI